MEMNMNVAIIGCGSIGTKRAKALGACKLVACVDQVREKAEALAKTHPHCEAFTDWQAIMHRSDINIILIATLHASLAEIATAALNAGKHILVEKPGGRQAHELD